MAIIEEFLTSIHGFLRKKDAASLQDWLRVEPPLPDHYWKLAAELKAKYKNSDALERYLDKMLPESNNLKADEGDVWPGFLAFMKAYLEFWRDVDFEDLLETHGQLSELANACITALSNATFGILILPTTIQLSAALAKLAMTLDKRPDLTRKLRAKETVTNFDQGETRKSLVESTAESIQRAFTICLTERSSNRSGIKDGKPEGKKVGIYSFANLVLKLLFKCRKTRLANQLFTNISQHSPPLSLYPASQRVTFLYYLGRFQMSNNHFYHAQNCLQAAYDQCHAQCISQRRMILIYLIASNVILGRFPSPVLMSRPESAGILEKFFPIAKAIKKGDFVAFKHALGPESGNEQWFFQKGILLPILFRCEVLVWRSLARRTFLLTYEAPGDQNSRKAPTLDFTALATAAQYCQKLMEGWQKPTIPPHIQRQPPDRSLVKPLKRKRTKLSATEGIIYGNKMPDVKDVEPIVASLIQQGLLHGFISHTQGKFAILGAKQRGGAVNAGFPTVWEVIKTRAIREGKEAEAPGWVKSERKVAMGGVVNLSGIARPVGSGS